MNDQKTEPVRAALRPLSDLAELLAVSKPTIFNAAHKGQIGGVVRVGQLVKIRNDAFEYHAQNGYGPGVLPFGAEPETTGDAAA